MGAQRFRVIDMQGAQIGQSVDGTCIQPVGLPYGVSATGVSGAGVTLTIPAAISDTGPGDGSYAASNPIPLFHYIGFLEIRQYAAAALAASATPTLVTTTNLPGNPVFEFDTLLAQGVSQTRQLLVAPPVVSLVGNATTTIVCPATVGAIWRVNVFYALLIAY